MHVYVISSLMHDHHGLKYMNILMNLLIFAHMLMHGALLFL
jgi:hypothetical protein